MCGSAECIEVIDGGGIDDTVWMLGCYRKGYLVLRKDVTDFSLAIPAIKTKLYSGEGE